MQAYRAEANKKTEKDGKEYQWQRRNALFHKISSLQSR
jgi:hypothetical protein